MSVAKLARVWALRWGVHPERAFVAGLLHDCARGLTWEQQRELLRMYRGRYFSAATRACPALWHNPAGVYLAQHTYGVRDSGILRAIALHSTGAPNMTRLDQIIFVADYCEPLRAYPGTSKIRDLGARDLSAAVRAVALAKAAYVHKQGAVLHLSAQALIKTFDLRP